MASVFDKHRSQVWKYQFEGRIAVGQLAGGTPTNQNVMASHVRSKMAAPDDILRDEISKVMVDRGVTAEEAAKLVGDSKSLNGFKRTPSGQLTIEGRHLKAALKEAISVGVSTGHVPGRGWGNTNKSALNFAAEHVVVDNVFLPLERSDGSPIMEQDEIIQRFVHTWRGTGVQYEEVLYDAEFSFRVMTDTPEFSPEIWTKIWLIGEQQGIGASRSQGFGRYEVIQWDEVEVTGLAGPAEERKLAGNKKRAAAIAAALAEKV